MLVGVLLMLKNEEQSIEATMNSIKDHIEYVIVYDTGSTDKTIDIIKRKCETHNQTLYLKQVNHFHSFPESRNEAIEFAETVDVKYVLMMDAGDELKTNLSPFFFYQMLSSIASDRRFGVIKQLWEEDKNVTDHSDIRFIRNRANCRYDLDYPVHEKIITHDREMPVYFNDYFYLYQNRDLYGKSTEKRYISDIEILSKAKPRPRNLFFLGQTYANIKDFKNALKYNQITFDLLKHKPPGFDNVPIHITTIRILDCGIKSNASSSDIIEYFERAVRYNKNSIDPYVIFFQYCINTNNVSYTLPYIDTVFRMKMEGDNINQIFYRYERWRLISVICLLSRTKLSLGKEACRTAIQAMNRDSDKDMYRQYEMLV
jgi:glycosyltransferase involved in cell wall biosynthesis